MPAAPHDSASSARSSTASSQAQDDPPSEPYPASPAEPATPEPLLPASRQPSYVSSPLNPHAPSRPESRGSLSPDAYAAPAVGPAGYPLLPRDTPSGSLRGSMLLYRLASDADPWDDDVHAPPPPTPFSRSSVASDAALSLFGAPSDSKYPLAQAHEKRAAAAGAFLPYVYDPTSDQSSPPDADDALHDPSTLARDERAVARLNTRGLANVLVVGLVVAGVISLFTAYPIVTFFHSNARNLAIGNNVQVNATGQVADLPHLPLVFSDEFNTEGRSFYPGDDPFWEAVDLWYHATQDMEWYDPGQVTTTNGSLRIRIEQADPASNHGLSYKSGMLQSWNKFCFTGGYIEVSASFPGSSSNVAGYWPGAWLMGNLGRPGYGASTDGVWPYSYTSCDTGTFPNQTHKDGLGPAAALHTDWGRSQYNFELSWLPGQRLSACTCPASAGSHPGPAPTVGRGAPEIDVFEAQKNKLGDGGKVSQSAQFAPFAHDYVSPNGTGAATFFDAGVTRQNTYQGSALQQAVSALTTVPERAYAGGAGGRGDGGGAAPDFRGADVDHSELGHVAELPARRPHGDDLPADLLIDYVRIYQQTDKRNVGCDPQAYPTGAYIAQHLQAYTNPNLTSWRGDAGFDWPKNSQYDGC
ncbi:beta-glucan synthesis-associated protein-domain-containing protein [Gautieria morchelliformis]|nr:beta-glucan synthesis-associated protein-domain-containing protein [Gautieria morchelliformis]